MNPDLNDIAVFTEVVTAGSFTKAAKSLGVPRSTVSRRVAELEKRLGVRLLQRTTRRQQLTDVGRHYYERSVAGLRLIDEAEACVQAAQDEPRGRVRLTAPFSLEHMLGPALARYLSLNPKVTIDVVLTQRMVDLIGEGFDLAVRATQQLPDSTLIARPLANGVARLYASAEYLASRGHPREPADLIEHDLIAFGPQQRKWTLQHVDGGARHEINIEPRLTINSPSLAHHAALVGAGIAMLPMDVSNLATTLVPVLPAYEGFRTALYLVYPSAKLISATLRTLRDHLIESFADPGAPLSVDAASSDVAASDSDIDATRASDRVERQLRSVR